MVDFTGACREHATARVQGRSTCRVEVGSTLLDYAHRALGSLTGPTTCARASEVIAQAAMYASGT